MSPLLPIAGVIAQGVVSGLLADTLEKLGKLIAPDGWKDAEELDRLFLLLEAAYGDEIDGFKHGRLARTLGTDPAFLEIYEELSTGAPAVTEAEQKAQHDALVSAIEPFVEATTEKTQRQLAEEVAGFLPYLVLEAKDASGKILHYLRQLTGLVEVGFETMGSRFDRIDKALAGRITTLIISADWPKAATDALKAAADDDEPGLALLNEALEGKDQAVELPRLLRASPDWMAEQAASLWRLIAVLCEEYGLWEEARGSWVTARERPGADYAGCSARAAEAASAAGDDHGAVELLNEARRVEPNHSRVALHDALALDSPVEALRAVDAIEPRDESTEALLHVVRASLHTSLRDLDAARRSLDEAAKAGAATTGSYRLVQGNLAVAEVLLAPYTAAQRITERVEASLALEQDLLSRKQPAPAAQAREQAISFYGLSGDITRARELLAEAAEIYESFDAAEPRLTIAMSAAQLERYELIDRLVSPQDTNARAALLRAIAQTTGDEAQQKAAAAQLEGLLDSRHEPIRVFAAIERLVIAGQAPGIGWSDEAQATLVANDIPMTAGLKAFWLERTGDRDGAERELLHYSDETWAITELMKLAGRAEDWPKAAGHGAALLDRDIDWVTRFAAADALRLAGEVDRATTEFTKIAEAVEAQDEVRSIAYSRLANERVAAQDFGAALALTEKWLQLAPEDVDARWMKAGTLAMLGSDRNALSAIENWSLSPRVENEYELAAQLYVTGLEPVQALRQIVALADDHNPPSERLETYVVRAALRAGATIPPDLADRVSPARFFEQFPQSQQLQRLTLEEVQQFLATAGREQAQTVQDVLEHIFGIGDMPTMALAALSGDIGGTWLRLSETHGLPLGYSDPELEVRERSEAVAAIGGSVLWDATSIFVVDHILAENSDAIRTAFPNARITQAALTELVAAARTLAYQSSTTAPAVSDQEPSCGTNAEFDAAAEEVADDEQRARAALEFAQKLTPAPDTDPASPQPEDASLTPETSAQLRAAFATYAAARRLGLAIYSDDRDIRRRAHLSGLPAFGTVAVLQALDERGVITSETHMASRRALLQHRGLGVHATVSELIQLGMESGYELTPELAIAVTDAFQWRGSIPLAPITWISFLYGAFRATPEKLVVWVARLLDAYRRALPEAPLDPPAQLLLAFALISHEPDATLFTRSLLRALDAARQCCSAGLGDPARDGLISLIRAVSSPKYPRVTANALVLRGWMMLPLKDQERLVHLLLLAD